MCGILGFVGANTQHNRDLVKALMLQLSLRGTHATGIATLVGAVIRSASMPVDAQTFFDHVTLDSHKEPLLKLIGHTRYSTSDLKWNQPIVEDNRALVMNGVISQEEPIRWPYPLRPIEDTTPSDLHYRGNDAEVALRFADAGCRAAMPGSWAICELETGGRLLAYRNAFRPLWRASTADCSVVCSTADALFRCGLVARPFPAGKVMDLYMGCWLFEEEFITSPDLQPTANSSFPDLQCSI